MESQSRSIAACAIPASTSRSDASDSTVVFPAPIDPDITNTGTIMLIVCEFMSLRALMLSGRGKLGCGVPCPYPHISSQALISTNHLLPNLPLAKSVRT